jgi:hypothetical protein
MRWLERCRSEATGAHLSLSLADRVTSQSLDPPALRRRRQVTAGAGNCLQTHWHRQIFNRSLKLA